MDEFVTNVMLLRADALRALTDQRRDLNTECQYPTTVSINEYKTMYEREGLATRVVSIYPDECWAIDPEVYESEGQKETDFEMVWKELNKELSIYHYLHRIDELSGIGQFGILLMGFDDGQPLNTPISGIDEKGEADGTSPTHKILFLRAFDESVVSISAYQTDVSNPRFGLPLFYEVEVEVPGNADDKDATGGDPGLMTIKIHWSRVIHVADNRKSSEVLGVPRQRPVYNRLLDLRKLLGGSAEMFWKGAFPGYSFEINPEFAGQNPTFDKASLRKEIAAYADGLQRYLAIMGVTAKSLAPQVADPRFHVECQLQNVAVTIGCPLRIFLGSEEAKLASSQDVRTWIKRLTRRQANYLTPMLVRPFVGRLIILKVLPSPKQFNVFWPDLNSPTQDDKAAKAVKLVTAMAKYLDSGCEVLMPPLEFLTVVVGLSLGEAEVVVSAAKKYNKKDDLLISKISIGKPKLGTAPIKVPTIGGATLGG